MSNVINIVVMGAYGRMGRTIAGLAAKDPELKLLAGVERSEALSRVENYICPVKANVNEALAMAKSGVVVDFTAPAATMATARAVSEAGWAMVIGTTGFDGGQKNILGQLAAKTPMLWSANMSVGVNALMRILPQLAAALGPDYDMEMVEIHHRHKKDAPSGTALMLGRELAHARGWELEDVRSSCRDGIIGERPDRQIGIQALRGGDVVGLHTVYFLGPGEMIEISHRAESRENFAMGALRAARWLSAQKAGRLYSMSDVLQ